VHPPTLIFQHVPRCGGTSLRRILKRQFDPSDVLELYGTREELELARYPTLAAVQHRTPALIAGHFPFGLHRYLPDGAVYVSMLRDPAERILSDYDYIVHNPLHVHHERVAGTGMAATEFVAAPELAISNRNGLTRAFAGLSPDDPVTCESLAAARHNLRSHYAVAGLCERFDASLTLMRRAFGWPIPYYDEQNVHPARGRVLPDDFRAAVDAHNQIDRELFHFAQELLAQRIEAQGPSFTRELELFTALNARRRTLVAAAAELLDDGDADSALGCLDEALRIDPRHARALAMRARILADRERLDDAQAAACAALAADPYEREAVLVAGDLLERTGHADEAAAVLGFYLRRHDGYDVGVHERFEQMRAAPRRTEPALVAASARLRAACT
jgi:tetratricopeptide (TPR) repeat protein